MKKIHSRKLALSAETVRTLSAPDLMRAIGGEAPGGGGGTIVVVGPIVTTTRSLILSGCKLPITETVGFSFPCGGGGGSLGGG